MEEFSMSWRMGRKVWVLFSSLHPWLQLRFFSIGAYGVERALLPAARLFIAMFSCALFFERGTNDTGEGDGCEPKSWQDELLRNIAVAVLGSMFSKLPLLLVKKLQRRRFKHKDDWDAEARRKQRLKWLVADVVQWSLGLFYIVFSTLFILSFVANINRPTEMQFLSSAVVVLAKQFFISPLIQAIFFALAGTAVLGATPVPEAKQAKEGEEQLNENEVERGRSTRRTSIASSLHYIVDELEEEAKEIEEKLEESVGVCSKKGAAKVSGVLVQIRIEGIDETQVTDASWHVLEASLVAGVAELAKLSEQDMLAPDGHKRSLHINGHCHSRSLFSQLHSLVAKPAPHSNGHLVTLVDVVLHEGNAEPDLERLHSADAPQKLASAIRKALGEECLGGRTLVVKVAAAPASTVSTKVAPSGEQLQQTVPALDDAGTDGANEVAASKSHCCAAFGVCHGRQAAAEPRTKAPSSGGVFALCMRHGPDAADVIEADPVLYS